MSDVIALKPGKASRPQPQPKIPAFAELITTSNFSFLRSGSHPEELVAAAMHLKLTALGLCDRNSFAGVVRGYVTARDNKGVSPDFRYLVGVRLCFSDGTPDIVTYPTDRTAYGRLCKLLTVGNKRGEKGNPDLKFDDLFGCSDLASKVRWVADADGDGYGYDVRSFEPDGQECLLEVKTTCGHERTPFWMTRRECDVAAEQGDAYRVRRVFHFRNGLKMFDIAPPLEARLMLTPATFMAAFR